MTQKSKKLSNEEVLKKEIFKKQFLLNEWIKLSDKLKNQPRDTAILEKSIINNQILPVIFHKLKNYLTPILGYTQILSSKTIDPKNLNRLNKINNNADILVNHFNTLKDFFSGPDIKKEELDLNDLIKSLEPVFASFIKFYKLKIEFNLDPNLIKIPLNYSQIKILIKNLVENGALAIQEKNIKDGIIKISTKMEQNQIQMVILDNGIGIKEDQKNLIFNLFYSNFKDRTGMGLPLCKSILKAHNGTIDLLSDSSHYTSSVVFFKLDQGSLSDKIVESSAIQNKILFLNDHHYLLEIIMEILAFDDAFLISSVKDHEKAIELIEEGEFDLIITGFTYRNLEESNLFKHLLSRNKQHKLLWILNKNYPKSFENSLKHYKISFITTPIQLFEIIDIIKNKLK